MDKRGYNNPKAIDCLKRLCQRFLSFAHRPPSASDQQDRQPAVSSPTSARLILIVELSGWTCTSLPHMLEQTGYAAQVVREEELALETLRHETPVLVIVGGVPESKFYRTLRCASSAPILALAPQRNEEQALSAFAAGVDQYQTGYVSEAEVVARVRALLRRGA